MSFDLSSKILLAEDVLLRKVDEHSFILFNMKSNSYFGFDATGHNFYQKLLEAESAEQALSNLANEYSVKIEDLKTDLLSFIEELQSAELISTKSQKLD